MFRPWRIVTQAPRITVITPTTNAYMIDPTVSCGAPKSALRISPSADCSTLANAQPAGIPKIEPITPMKSDSPSSSREISLALLPIARTIANSLRRSKKFIRSVLSTKNSAMTNDKPVAKLSAISVARIISS
jgi:hypothetical protein